MSSLPGNNSTELENAGAQAAGRALATTVLQRNPIVAVAAALLGPLIGLFRRRGGTPPVTVNKMKLESYSSTPVQGPAGRQQLPSKDPAGRKPAGRESGPPVWPSRGRRAGPPLRRKRPTSARLGRVEGGVHHG